MTMEDGISKLLERVEKATGPSYALECEIAVALEPERAVAGLLSPNYTRSLDAALALVERKMPGRDIDLEIRETMTDGKVLRITDATIYAQAYSDDRRDFKAYGSSPALALIAALLRATGEAG